MKEPGSPILEAACRWLQDQINRDIERVDAGQAEDLSPEGARMLAVQEVLLPLMSRVRLQESQELTDDEREEEALMVALKAIVARERTVSLFDSTLLADGFAMAGMYLDKGDRSFDAYAEAMQLALGERIKPYLRTCYEAARHYPEFDSSEMSDDETCARAFARIVGAPS